MYSLLKSIYVERLLISEAKKISLIEDKTNDDIYIWENHRSLSYKSEMTISCGSSNLAVVESNILKSHMNFYVTNYGAYWKSGLNKLSQLSQIDLCSSLVQYK